jgi:valyl-tRNA synthetase
MIFNGLEFMGQKPFSDVYIYATVLDARGDRMSKSKGNGVNPLLLLQQYGADATRYAVVTQAGKSQSFRFVQEKQCPHCKEWSLQDSRACDKCGKPFEGEPEWRAPQVAQARLFCNKIWQASRFVLMNLGAAGASAVGIGSPCSMERLEDRWILSRLADTVRSVNEGLASYDLDVATRVLHEFVWSEFCDWYIEIAKPRLNAGDPTIRSNLACILDTVLRLLHPFMPFLTEAIWQTIPGHGESIMLSSFPVAVGMIDPPAEELMGQVMDLVVRIRNIRTELKLQPGLRIPVFLAGVSPELQQVIELVEQRARCQVGLEDTMSEDETQGAGSAVSSSGAVRIRIPLEGLVDFEKERKRI